MNKYNFSIPLEYNKTSNYDNSEMTSELNFKLDKNIEYKLQLELSKGDFTANEDCYIRLTDKDNKFILSFDSIYADDESYAYEMATMLIDKVCCVLTFIFQGQNSNFQHFHPKFTYKIKDIICKEEVYIKYKDFISKPNEYMDENGNKTIVITEKISFREHMSDLITLTVKTDLFGRLFCLHGTNTHLSFLLESYYRSLGELEFISKYYNLFTIIEYIETNFKEHSSSKNIFSQTQKKELKKMIEEKIAEYFKEDNSEIKTRFFNRFSSLIADVTDKTRAQKLCEILNNHFEIYEINETILHFEINEETIKKFIDTRNSLFHAKNITEYEKKELNNLTNKLMALCKTIIELLIRQC